MFIVGEAIDSTPGWYLSREFLMCAMCILFLLPLCLPKTLKVLSYSRCVDFNNHDSVVLRVDKAI